MVSSFPLLPFWVPGHPCLHHKNMYHFLPWRTLLSQRSGGLCRTEPAGSSAPWLRGRGSSGHSPGSTPAGRKGGYCSAPVTGCWMPLFGPGPFPFFPTLPGKLGMQERFVKLLFGSREHKAKSCATGTQLWKQLVEPSGRKVFTKHTNSSSLSALK